MRKLVVLAVLGAPALAAAQPGMYSAQPPPSPSPPAPPTAAVEVEPKVRLGIAVIAASPKGDWKDDLAAETSPGLQLQLGFTLAPNISLFGGARYVRVNYDEAVVGTSDLRLSHRELQLGVRFMSPIAPTAKFFAEGNVHSATITASFQGDRVAESGVGLGVRAGVTFMIDRKIGFSLAAGYGTADIEVNEDGDELEDAWLTGDAGLDIFF